jgi:hypothetical protein
MSKKVDRRNQIRSEMVLRGIKAAQIARDLGVTRQHVTLVIAGRSTSKRVVEALIEAGVPKRLFHGDEDDEGREAEAIGWT